MSLHDVPLTDLDGRPTDLRAHAGEVLLAVNVASKCGFTPQYEGLEALHTAYRDRGFSVLGFPCNQFLFQEPGGADAISACGVTYGVTFPVFGKLKVRGRDRSPLYDLLTEAPDADGKAGRVRWNFEKFLVGRDGTVLRRYRSRTTPDQLVADVEAALAGRPLPA
ncbi:MAG: Peroxiredoxin [Frankiales bacterium]|jgi:glutathione peroxidase|nr:Peroxiredoxin [Frankiales bacterium]